jgi:preprotein translocase subunit SecE
MGERRKNMSDAAPTKTQGPKSDGPKTSPLQFAREVRAEARKVTWATRPEVLVSTIFVFIMVMVAALFFMGVDFVLRFVIGEVLGLM